MIDTTELRAALLTIELGIANKSSGYEKAKIEPELYRIRSSLEIIEEILNG